MNVNVVIVADQLTNRVHKIRVLKIAVVIAGDDMKIHTQLLKAFEESSANRMKCVHVDKLTTIKHISEVKDCFNIVFN
jgi:hypothetical protein